MKYKILVLLVIIFYQFETFGQENKDFEIHSVYIENGTSFPASFGYVNDFENIFSSNQIEKLEKIISDYEKKTEREIAVITIESIDPFSNIEEYANNITNKIGAGKPGKDNGLTIVVSSKLKKIRISTGHETKHILTDKVCKRIIDDIMIPEFKKENYYLGVENGVLELMKKWN